MGFAGDFYIEPIKQKKGKNITPMTSIYGAEGLQPKQKQFSFYNFGEYEEAKRRKEELRLRKRQATIQGKSTAREKYYRSPEYSQEMQTRERLAKQKRQSQEVAKYKASHWLYGQYATPTTLRAAKFARATAQSARVESGKARNAVFGLLSGATKYYSQKPRRR